MLHSRFLGGLFSVPMLFGLATAASAASFNGIPIPEAPSFGAPLPTGDDFGGFFVTARVAGVDQSGFSPNVSALVDKTGNGLGSGYSPSWKSSLGVGVSGEMGYNFRYGQWAFGPSLVIGTQFDDASLSGSYNWLGVGPFQRYLSTTARANLGYVITSRLMLYGFVGAGIDAANYGFNSNRQDRAFGAVDAGVGAEYALFQHWGILAEYEFRYDFPQSSYGYYSGADQTGVTRTGLASMGVEPYSHSLSIGLRYHF